MWGKATLVGVWETSPMERTRSGRVVVVGSINMDIVAEVEAFPHPGETIAAKTLRQYPGGKGANQAVAAKRAGAEAKLVGAVGDDPNAYQLLSFLQRDDVDVTNVDRYSGPSGTAIITVDAHGENTIVITTGANRFVTPGTLKPLEFFPSDVILLQNEVPLDTNREALERAKAAGAQVVCNPAPWIDEGADVARRADVLIVNEVEFAQFIGSKTFDLSPQEVETKLSGLNEPKNVIVTLGEDGAVGRFGGETVHRPAISIVAKDSTGAGDAFSGAFAAALASGITTARALEFANVAAGLSVERLGAGPSMPTLAEIEQRCKAEY